MTDWFRLISALDIGTGVLRDGISVLRLSENRFVVLKDGIIYDEHYGRMKVGLSIARALEFITGEAVIAPCADCGAPRTVRSYCNVCFSRRVQESKRRAG